MGWHFNIQFHDLSLRTEYHSVLNLLLGNDSHLVFMIFQTSSIGFNMPIKGAKKNKFTRKAKFFVLDLKLQNIF